ncbi:hypothetical protein EHI48_25280 [Rhizobium sp. WSM1325]|nr:hypothetical protein EHI43_24535 [Rhizobium leguminosarum]RWY66524.1 hypothetical protein EHI46_27810 [Rhizobium leguminosarum]RWY71365.1 hypothetical protein EHI48_25280 [Rhizobium leguminosarum]
MTAVANPLLLREFGAGCRNGITMREVNSGRRALLSRAFNAEMQNEMGGAAAPPLSALATCGVRISRTSRSSPLPGIRALPSPCLGRQ